MKKRMEQFRVEDWVVVWVSIPLLALAAIVPAGLPKVPATLLGGAAWSNIAYLFAIVLVVLYAGCLLLRRPTRGLLPSLVVVFAVSLLAQIVAKIPAVSVLFDSDMGKFFIASEDERWNRCFHKQPGA